MKIRISPEMMFEVSMKEEYSLNELDQLVFILNNVRKIFGRDMFSSPKRKRHDEVVEDNIIEKRDSHFGKKYHHWTTDRNEAIKIVKMYYSKNKEAINSYLNEHNIRKPALAHFVHSSVKKHNIQPEEIGIIEYPLVGRNVKWKQ